MITKHRVILFFSFLTLFLSIYFLDYILFFYSSFSSLVYLYFNFFLLDVPFSASYEFKASFFNDPSFNTHFAKPHTGSIPESQKYIKPVPLWNSAPGIHSVHNPVEPYIKHAPHLPERSLSHLAGYAHGYNLPETMFAVEVPNSYKPYDFLRYPWHEEESLCPCRLTPVQLSVLTRFWLKYFDHLFEGSGNSFTYIRTAFRNTLILHSKYNGFLRKCPCCDRKRAATL